MHRTVFGFGLALCFVMLLYIPSWADVFCVDPGGGGTHTDLQNALTAAESNSEDDTIKVVKGLYNGNFTYDSSKGDSLVLEGGYDAGCGCREIDPESNVPCMEVDPEVSFILRILQEAISPWTGLP